VSAITGQSRAMVTHYARLVNQKKLAAATVLKWEGAGEKYERGTNPSRVCKTSSLKL
jgi:hypothetical protein